MFEFIAIATALAAITALLIVRPLLAGRRREDGDDRDAADVALYRDQLAEIDRDRERGVIGEAEAEGAKAEIARRLIAADRRLQARGTAARAPAELTRKAALATLAAAPLLGAGLYLAIGNPGAPDRPLSVRDLVAEARAQRPSQAEAAARAAAEDVRGPRAAPGGEGYARLVAELERVTAERPQDVEGQRLLASAYLRQERFAEAWPVLDRLIALEGENAPADLFAAKAEAMVLAAGGYVSPEAEDALAVALERQPSLPVARYYAGHALAQSGQVEEALALWRRLERDAPSDAPWLGMLRQILARADGSGVVGPAPVPNRSRPGEAPGLAATGGMPPLPGDVDRDAAEAMAALPAEERRQVMAANAEALEARLDAEGGPPEKWAQLLRSYRMLDRIEDARRVYRLSQERLSGSEAGFVREQALAAGVIDE
ncbi:MAG: c-type cytochrome biogenesis protein CcmI [Paracoccaceae bacterium]